MGAHVQSLAEPAEGAVDDLRVRPDPVALPPAEVGEVLLVVPAEARQVRGEVRGGREVADVDVGVGRGDLAVVAPA